MNKHLKVYPPGAWQQTNQEALNRSRAFRQGLQKGQEATFFERDGNTPYNSVLGWEYIETKCTVTGFNWPLILTNFGSWHYSRLKKNKQ